MKRRDTGCTPSLRPPQPKFRLVYTTLVTLLDMERGGTFCALSEWNLEILMVDESDNDADEHGKMRLSIGQCEHSATTDSSY